MSICFRQCFTIGVWGICSRRTTVNKYVENAVNRKWKYRDGNHDDEADGVVDVGDLAELEYSIVDQQPNAIVLELRDTEPHRQDSTEPLEEPSQKYVERLLSRGTDIEEEEILTTPTIMNGIDDEVLKRTISGTSDTNEEETESSSQDNKIREEAEESPKNAVVSTFDTEEENVETEASESTNVNSSDYNDNIIREKSKTDHEGIGEESKLLGHLKEHGMNHIKAVDIQARSELETSNHMNAIVQTSEGAESETNAASEEISVR